jgi:hypothetical protein
MGRGVIAGNEVFWPTRDTIYVLDVVRGERTRSPLSLTSFSEGGANLAAAHGHLIVASHDKLMALGPQPFANPNAAAPTEVSSAPDRAGKATTTALD